MHRARSLAPAVVALVVVWSSLPGVATTRAVPARQDEIPLDLAALAIYPQDMGTDGYVLIDGQACLTATACANPVFFGAETKDSLTAQGLNRAYALALGQFGSGENPSVVRTMASTIAEYKNPGGAGQGLKTFLSWLADPASEVPVSDDIGSGAQMFDIHGPLPGDPNATGVVGLRFRVGSIVAGIEIRDYTGKAPSHASVEKLAKKVESRIKAEQDEPELGALVVHHRSFGHDYYVHRSGVTVRTYQQSDDEFASDSAEFRDAAVQDVFLSRQTLATGRDGKSIDVLLAVTLYRLSSATQASAYLNNVSTAFAEERERIGAPTQEPEDPPSVGDESVWFLNVYTDAYQAMGFVRSGNIVARIIWQRSHEAKASEVEKLLTSAERELLPGAAYSAQSQVDCIENLGCPGLTKLSSRLLP
jgi:hypothetical protein